jgi:hypothetical protein
MGDNSTQKMEANRKGRGKSERIGLLAAVPEDLAPRLPEGIDARYVLEEIRARTRGRRKEAERQ